MSEEILEVKIKKRELSLVVWLVPLLALIVGGWMVYKYYAKLGPRIEITFKKSGGLEPKNSYIKFRDVKVGVIEQVEIVKGSEGVRVIARMNKDVEPFLNETTKFWIVKPEIGAGKIRGLDALVSGAYIQMFAKLGKESKKVFQGLDEPPLNVGEEPGATVRLVAQSTYDLKAGSPVYYKEMQVGRVEKVEFSKSGDRVFIYLFIKEPFTRYINSTTKFWKIGALALKLGDSGLEVQTRSLSQILAGGVEFATKDLRQKQRISGDFFLYPSKALANRKRIGVGQEDFRDFLMRFNENVGYLSVGAPVKIDGFVVGHVRDVVSNIDITSKKIDSYVIASIDMASFRQRVGEDGFKNLQKLVQKGLCARLEETNPILNSLFVNLVFTENNATLQDLGGVYLFPTTGAKRNQVVAMVEKILEKFQKMPIERTLDALSQLLEQTRTPLKKSLEALQKSLQEVNALLENNATKVLPTKVATLLDELEATLQSYKELAKSYGKDSLFKDRLDALLKDLDQATKDAKKLLQKLDKKPNAIIFGD